MELDGYADLVAIGSGGNAHVYRAVDGSGRAVAIKVLQGGGDEAVARRFTREVGLMEALVDIDGLVPTLDSGVTGGGQLFLVMPLFDGGSLNDELKLGPVAWPRAAALVRTVAVALAEAHGRQILHLDVKPANVLLDGSGAPWLSDFGIAEVVGSTASMSGAMMTPAYTPPERLRDVKPSTSTDVYGLGATLFALLAGVAPFGSTTRSTNPAAVMLSVLNDPVPVDVLPSDVPPELVGLVAEAMAKDPEGRLGSVAEFVERLGEILAAHGHEAPGSDDPGEATIVGSSVLRDLQPSTTAPTPTTSPLPTPEPAPVPTPPTDPDQTIAAPSESSRVGEFETPGAESERKGRPLRWLVAAAVLVGVVGVATFAVLSQRDGELQTAGEPVDENAVVSEPSGTIPIEEVSTTTLTTTTTPAVPDLGLEGETISVLAKNFEDAELSWYPEVHQDDLGVTLDVSAIDGDAPFERALEGAEDFDLVVMTDKAEMDRRCADGLFVPLEDAAVETLRVDYQDGLIVQGGGKTCGAAITSDVDFVIWYNPSTMDDAGYALPESWADIESLSDEMIAAGKTPWCMGFADSGGLGGVAAVEWMENVLIRTVGLETWDGVVAGDLPWSDPVVASSFTWFDEFLIDDRIAGGRVDAATNRNGRIASTPLFTSPPGCYFYAAPHYQSIEFEIDERTLIERTDYDFIPFPAIDQAQGNRQIVRATFIAAATDRPSALSMLQYLLSTDGQENRARRALRTANRNVDEFAFIHELELQYAELTRQADDVRTSASASLGSSVIVEWWSQMRSLIDGTATVTEVLAALDEQTP